MRKYHDRVISVAIWAIVDSPCLGGCGASRAGGPQNPTTGRPLGHRRSIFPPERGRRSYIREAATKTKLILVLASCFLLLATGCGGGPAVANSTGGSAVAAPGLQMTAARAEHMATLLPDGEVLIAGGVGGASNPPEQTLASAELYDPSSSGFIPVGNMTAPRTRSAAALLANGNVLIVGGVDGNTLVSTAEIFDPSKGMFSATGNTITGSNDTRSVLLPDGRVFVAQDGSAAEIYDPLSGTFSLTAAYAGPSPIQVDTATLLPDGRILITGCAEQCGLGTTQLYDPGTGLFSLTGPRQAWDSVSTATVLTDGKVLFVEGNDSAMPDDVEIYDPSSGTFTHIGYTQSIHEFSTATRLPDGRVLVAGGQVADGNGSNVVEIYDPATMTFAAAPPMITGRHSHTATLLPDGSVLFAGGYSIWPNATSSAEIYRPPSAH